MIKNNLFVLPNFLFFEKESVLVEKVIAGFKATSSHDLQSIFGQFSIAVEKEESLFLIRDRLGINKLFYSIDPIGKKVTYGNYLYDVASETGDYNNVYSVPPGSYVQINKNTLMATTVAYYDAANFQPAPNEKFNYHNFQEQVEAQLSKVFAELNSRFPDTKFIVCLSGGLDSSVIATFAKKFLKNVLAVSFSFKTSDASGVSEDLMAAKSVSAALDLEFLPIVIEKKFSEPMLIDVLKSCQDWRDFNVHCAWLNYEMGSAIRKKFPNEKVIFLTGDLMNEYVADYTPVEYHGQVYYQQPKISRDRLRRFYIYGLDTSDREIGIFHQFNIMTIQPYSIVTEQYLTVPEDIINLKDCKEKLNLAMVKNQDVVNAIVKTKVRAQVGGKDGGTLGLFHDHGINHEYLKKKWDDIFRPTTKENELKEIIYSGRYRSQ